MNDLQKEYLRQVIDFNLDDIETWEDLGTNGMIALICMNKETVINDKLKKSINQFIKQYKGE
jgi:hypothetical protein